VKVIQGQYRAGRLNTIVDIVSQSSLVAVGFSAAQTPPPRVLRNQEQQLGAFAIQRTDIVRFKSVPIDVHEKESTISQPTNGLRRLMDHELTVSAACVGIEVTNSCFAAY